MPRSTAQKTLNWGVGVVAMLAAAAPVPMAARQGGADAGTPQERTTTRGAAAANPPKVQVDEDGTVHIPEQVAPISPYLSPEAKAYVTEHLKAMQGSGSVGGMMAKYVVRQRELFPVDRDDTKIAGVHAFVYTPTGGVSARNRDRVLIDLHGGGFNGCWPTCAELESMPLASLAKIKVVAVDYRQGPANKFPAASEDVGFVYKELLKTYSPENIGVFGCSAGGSLTAMSMAWFQKERLPRPGAIGIFCAGAGSGGLVGDSNYSAQPLGEARVVLPGSSNTNAYLAGTSTKDPLVAPMNAPETLANFPPTLIVTATRGFELSAALYTHTQLVRLGVEADLHVWEGLFHGFFYNPDVPESKDAYNVMVKFFDRHLGRTK